MSLDGVARSLPMVLSACGAVLAFATTSGCGGAAQQGSGAGFGVDGKVLTAGFDLVRGGLVIQDDGRIVVTSRNGLIRYTHEGQFDRAFGSGGKVKEDWGALNAVAIEHDGKLVVAGNVVTGTYQGLGVTDCALARYTRHGRLDPSFGEDGKVQTHLVLSAAHHSSCTIGRLAAQPDGKILALASTTGWAGNSALVRYTASGRLDPSFGRGGKVLVELTALTIALQNDGRIVVAGVANWSSDIDDPRGFALARYTSEGKLDPTFGRGGLVLTRAPFRHPSGEPARLGPIGHAEFASPDAMAIRPDGKIVLAGSSISGIALARYGADGRLDPSFGHRGMTNDDPQRRFHQPYEGVYATAFQRDGKIVSVGVSGAPHSDWKTNVALARHTENGHLDAGFGDGGSMLLGELSYADAAAIQRDGKILLGGGGALARFLPDGRLDR
jgi:uncharacterized delta-60 repeat protein